MGNSNSGHVCHSPQHASSPVYVSNLGYSSIGGKCSDKERSMFMFPLFPLLNKVIQKLRTTQEDKVILIAHWWSHNRGFHIYYVFFSYRQDLLSQQMASRTICILGGSHAALPSSIIFEEVSRLAAASRRHSTNRVYDDRWLRFAHWAAGQGMDLLGPTAAQIAIVYIISLILRACHLNLSKDTRPA